MDFTPTSERLKFLVDEDLNLEWNKKTWGRDEDLWRSTYKYGYYWPGGTNQKNNIVTLIAEKYLLPHLDGRRDLKIIELAPGGGRFTPELIRLSREMHLVDYNEACISICKERFQYYPNMQFYVNDGKSISIVPGDDFDLIACFDSMVHMAGSVIEKYIASFVHKLKVGGIVWLDHSGKGVSEAGCRSDMTKEKMVDIAEANGFFVSAQSFRSPTDCISVLIKQ